ncbi:UTP pyrophosphatase [Alteromonas sp. 38]|uniref:M48 metallopeptidase family protein n=1 Tax=Alteromonas TaxID=226 RepID=UPI0012F099DF|nr:MULTISPECIES: YgjP-like metallopeptidase domain-containing protein [Alteromonas]CAD5263690.1 UTP pyrophosphatase [Alteromonas sp. 154]VXC18805.1 UTP pyrophosphatase [Alteromonas sp. 38]
MSEYARYFNGYPQTVVEQALQLIADNKLSNYLVKKYPIAHTITTDKLLYNYATDLKKRYVKNAPPFGRAAFKKQGDMVTNALGTHTYRMQGKTRKHDLAINSDLLYAPEPLLKALVVHELAHFKEKDHNKGFYQLCCYMEPQYHQLELDLRLFCVAVAMGENPYR